MLTEEIHKRRTFAIISHPDAGKTTLTEKLLLFGGAIQLAGSIKSRKADRHATSDWLAMEQERGISVTTSVMQFPYKDCIINLLDTPGHGDFSEDTYRTLTAVDSALMAIDAVKGVEARTIKLLEVCRLRQTPIITFINKLDRDGREPLDLLDEIESVLKMQCIPVTWPIGMGKHFKGIYHLHEDKVYLYQGGSNEKAQAAKVIDGLDNPALPELLGADFETVHEELELIRGTLPEFDKAAYLKGEQTPVFFGSALNNFGIAPMLDTFTDIAPSPLTRETTSRTVEPDEKKLTGFVFKIQANMDPNHRDRIAFMRICSGKYEKGMRMRHVRLERTQTVSQALTFLAGERSQVEEAYPGDIIGLHNHGTIKIGDTFTEGEALQFTGIPNFAPELFRIVRLKDPLKTKALLKGVLQLAEEGATQVFRPLETNDIILGAVGVLQFDVVAHRLKHEYGVQAVFEPSQIHSARWVTCDDKPMMESFKKKHALQLALDNGDHLAYLATSSVNLSLTKERWPDIRFHETREH